MSYASEFKHDNRKKDRFEHIEQLSKDYRVFVNGEEACVYTCRISEYPFNTVWQGHQRDFSQTVGASFVNLVSEETLHIRVIPAKEYGRIILKPYSKGIKVSEEKGEICFDIKPGDQLVLELDSYRRSLYLFCSAPIICENPAKVTHYFGPGIHFPGKITLKSGESVYAHKDALVFGCICAEDAENIHVYGNGVFDDSGEARITDSGCLDYTNGNFKLYNCKNVKLEGLLFKNSALWCVNLFTCSDVIIDGIKVFGQWRYNTDGIDLCNCRDVLIKNSFIHSFDDTITIKGFERYAGVDNERITVDGCVLWCDWGKCCEVGIETSCRYFRDITFKNCDILRGGNTALDIQNGECAEIERIAFENINVEYNSFDTPEQYQNSDDEVYTRQNETAIPYLISFENHRFRVAGREDIWKSLLPDVDTTGIRQSSIHHVTVNNINVYYDNEIEKLDGKYNVPIRIKNLVDGVTFDNITVQNVFVNGEKLTKETAVLYTEDAVDSDIL